MGINPLIYYQDKEKLIFASEMKAIFSFGIPKILNHESVHTYFQLNYLPSNCSIIQNVRKLEPGTYLEVSPQDVSIHRYYQIPSYNPDHKADDYETAKQKLRNLLDDS